jgi:hypothetical protein
MKVRLLVCLLLLATACSSPSPPPNDATRFAASMASTWHYVGAPQRVEVGIFASDPSGVRAVTQGTVDLSFSFLGSDGSGSAGAGPTATAHYVPVPGTSSDGQAPTVATGSRGVYEAEDVTFDHAGLWQVTLTATIDGADQTLKTTFPVSASSEIPAPGDRALRTENLTVRSKHVPKAAIDSMAEGGNGIPDPELHRWTIADAIAQHRPALVLFGTPAHCTSQFCGPEVTELQRLAGRFPDRAVFIHIEIWKDYNASPQVVNKAAADWLLRKLPDGSPEMTEPWLYLIDADGKIADRWGPLFDTDEVAAALQALPPMRS